MSPTKWVVGFVNTTDGSNTASRVSKRLATVPSNITSTILTAIRSPASPGSFLLASLGPASQRPVGLAPHLQLFQVPSQWGGLD